MELRCSTTPAITRLSSLYVVDSPSGCGPLEYWGVIPNLGDTFLGVPMIRIVVYQGLHWDPPRLGNYTKVAHCFWVTRLSRQILHPKP